MTKLQAFKGAFIEGLMRVTKNSKKKERKKKAATNTRPLKILKRGEFISLFFSPSPFSTMNISAVKLSGMDWFPFK